MFCKSTFLHFVFFVWCSVCSILQTKVQFGVSDYISGSQREQTVLADSSNQKQSIELH